jgi:putative glycosyltransferase (TIGR04348 family)
LAKPSVIIISPALAAANNGNWQTASRWLRFLRRHYCVRLAASWDGSAADIMIALHARRSAAAIAAFAQARPAYPLIVVLTGTDLYRDIASDADAQRSLELATRLVVLQEHGLSALPADLRHKTVVIHQSAPSLRPMRHHQRRDMFDITMVGHLREEKNPDCFMQAAAMTKLPDTRFIQIGGALDASLAEQARIMQHHHPHYRWLGNLSHAKTRRLIRHSHLLAVPSNMEGGANVIIEAIRSGVPVLASDISGNRGMLGEGYAGYFPVDEPSALASLIARSMQEPAFYAILQKQCTRRAPLFAPLREQTALSQLLDNVRHPEQEHS